MFEEAVQKLENEMSKNESHPYIQLIGKFLLAHLEEKPEHAEQILAQDTSIAKSLETMGRFAQSKQHQGMAMVSEEQGYSIVLKYFGCWEGEPIDLPPEPAPRPIVPPTPRVPSLTSAKAATLTRSPKTQNNNSNGHGQLSLFDFAQDATNGEGDAG
jgi:hypothetical protein